MKKLLASNIPHFVKVLYRKYHSSIYMKARRHWKYFVNFLWLNKAFIASGRISRGHITPNQKVRLTGRGQIEIGNNVSFGLRFGGYFRGEIELQARKPEAKIVIKDNVSINNNLFVCALDYIEIGKDCLIGHNVEMCDCDGHGIAPSERNKNGIIDPIIIGDNVWFGNNCTILRGTVIAENSVVAAGAVVKGKFEANSIIGGVPAKLIKRISD